MEITTSCHAIRKDRALSAAQGTGLSFSGLSIASLMGTDPRVAAFAGVKTYVANQESPPRGPSPA